MRCAGRLTLLTMTGKGRHRHKVGVGGRNINLKGRRSLTITMGLDARGRKLLKAAHTLHVRMAITQGKRSVLNRQYTLRQPRRAPQGQGQEAGSHAGRRGGRARGRRRHPPRPRASTPGLTLPILLF